MSLVSPIEALQTLYEYMKNHNRKKTTHQKAEGTRAHH
jgi:hypothetical protein